VGKKYETRILKYETNTKFKWSNAPNYESGFQPPTKMTIESYLFWNFEFLSFEIVSDFVLKISELKTTLEKINLIFVYHRAYLAK